MIEADVTTCYVPLVSARRGLNPCLYENIENMHNLATSQRSNESEISGPDRDKSEPSFIINKGMM